MVKHVLVLVAIAVLAMSGVVQAGIIGQVIQMNVQTAVPPSSGDVAGLSLYPDFNNPVYVAWMVSRDDGTFGVYEWNASATPIFDQTYGLNGGAVLATAAEVFYMGSHNGVGEPVTYSSFPAGANGLSAVDRPSLAWTWPSAGAITMSTKLINLPESGRLEWYFNHGDGGYTHAWTATRYNSLDVAQESDQWNVTSADFAEIEVGVDFSGAQAGDYMIVQMVGGNPTWHAMGVAIPEPATLTLLALGGVALIRRRSR